MFNVFQNQIKENYTDAQLHAKREISCFGSSEWEKKYFDFYTKTAVCDAEHCEEVFELMNAWNDREKVYFWNGERPYSLSVGDIIQHTESKEFYMVEDFGFKIVKVN